MRKSGSRIYPMLVAISSEPEKRGARRLILRYRSRGWRQRTFPTRGLHPESATFFPISGHQFSMTVSKQLLQFPSVWRSRSLCCNGCSDRDCASLHYRRGREGVISRRNFQTPHKKCRDKCAKPVEKAVCGTDFQARKTLSMLQVHIKT